MHAHTHVTHIKQTKKGAIRISHNHLKVTDSSKKLTYMIFEVPTAVTELRRHDLSTKIQSVKLTTT